MTDTTALLVPEETTRARVTRDLVIRDQKLQRRMCDPDFNPSAAAFFIFNFCMTQDEEQDGATCYLPDPSERGKFCLAFVEWLDRIRVSKKNGLDRKARRMLHTWLVCLYDLWATQWVPGYSALLLSKSEGHVDDGGKGKIATFSMFGKIRHAYENLPEHIKKPCRSSYMSFECAENGAWLMGRAPSPDAGRAGGFTAVRVDECAFMEFMRQIHVAIDPACKNNKLYFGTVNGPDNCFADLWKNTPPNWEKFDANWWDDSAHRDGIRDTEEGTERDRYGMKVSPWFVDATQSLSDEEVAQEYLKRFDKSTTGQIWRAYAPEIHVASHDFDIDPGLDVYVGADYGSSGVSAGAVGQPVGGTLVRVLVDYEWQNLGGAPEHASNLWALLEELGYKGGIEQVHVIGGPDTDITTGGGQTIGGYFRSFGFVLIRQCRVRGPGSVDRRIEVVRVAFRRRRVELSPRCRVLRDRIPQYKKPVNRVTGAVGKAPAPGMANHICDAFGYLVCETITIENGMGSYDVFSPLRRQPVVVSERYGFDENDDLPPPVPGRRVPGGRLLSVGDD
jgi:hypothetical protein